MPNRLITNAVFCSLLVLQVSFSWAQEATVKGRVTSKTGEPVPYANILDRHSAQATSTDDNGHYELKLAAGSSTIVTSFVGFKTHEVVLQLSAGETKTLNVVLEEDQSTLQEVEVLGKSEIRLLQETGFNAIAVDATPFHNTTTSVTQILNSVSGVKIQEEGGLGSRSNVTINGLSGRHVRFFIDGMPMDAMSPAFQLNNIPQNLLSRVEVYKGVVPINFGSDALGGAVNFVTKQTPGKYVDLSYSYGSFNTHLTFLNAGITTAKGFTAQLIAYQNYSDNDYFVNATIKDFETNLLSKTPQRVRRFHDGYHNEAVVTKIGVVNKPYADQFFIGFTLGKVYDEIQHPAYMNLAFGEKYQTSDIIMPAALYKKDDLLTKGLDVSVAANYDFGGGHNYDLSDREYNWLGQWKHSNSLGEIAHSNYEYKNKTATINANINYEISDGNRITINNVASYFSRKGDEKVANDDYINQKPRVNNRNVLGVGWNKKWNDDLSTSVFGKMYHYTASAYLNLSNTLEDNFQTVTKGDTKYGYGLTAAYFVTRMLQLKGSYELACRLPVSNELFGEVFGFYVANFDLKPEQSQNFNVGFNYNIPFNRDHVLNADMNFFYRRTTDFIRLNVNYSQGEGSYENTQLVKTPGIDGELRYSYKHHFTAGASVSYLKPKNWTEGSTYYKAVLPNQPNFFINLNATYFLKNILTQGSRLSFTYNLQFIDEFLYDYDTYQASNRASIPVQWNHSVYATYSLKDGRYNISVDCKNLLDEELYDNYSLQKPGRSFSVKLRYFINKM